MITRAQITHVVACLVLVLVLVLLPVASSTRTCEPGNLRDAMLFLTQSDCEVFHIAGLASGASPELTAGAALQLALAAASRETPITAVDLFQPNPAALPAGALAALGVGLACNPHHGPADISIKHAPWLGAPAVRQLFARPFPASSSPSSLLLEEVASWGVHVHVQLHPAAPSPSPSPPAHTNTPPTNDDVNVRNRALSLAEACEAAAHGQHLRLTRLELVDVGLDDPAVDELAARLAAQAPLLRKLSLAHNTVGPVGAAALARSSLLARLERLDLNHNPRLGDAGAAALLAARPLKLQSLSMQHTGFGEAAAQTLAQGLLLGPLTSLDISNNPHSLGAAAVRHLVAALATRWRSPANGQSQHPNANTAISWLDLSMCDLSDRGAVEVAELFLATASCRLERIALSANDIGDKGAAALAEAITWSSGTLQSLDLSYNRITDVGAEALLRAAVAAHARSKIVLQLSLQRNNLSEQMAALVAEANADPTAFAKE